MNAFLDIAERQLATPVKAKHRAREKRALNKAPMTPTPMEKALHEQQTQMRRWCAWHSEKESALFASPHGKDIKRLKTFIRTMTLSSAGALVRLVEQAPWRRVADRETRHDVIFMIGHEIMKLRERNGLEPFDDSLPGEESTAFEKIRDLLQ